jgi:hypothetical protein
MIKTAVLVVLSSLGPLLLYKNIRDKIMIWEQKISFMTLALESVVRKLP